MSDNGLNFDGMKHWVVSQISDALKKIGYDVPDSYNSSRRNYEVWQNWHWEKGGEEWTESPEWKQSVIDDLMLKYVEPKKVVLEIGPGAGRWTEALQKISSRLILVDLSDKCISMCRQKFQDCDNIEYFVNDGTSLDFIPDGTVDFVWSFDVFVHINTTDTEGYIRQLSRILARDGRGLIHHAGDGGRHGGWRSRMTAEMFSDMLEKYGFTVIRQFDAWGENDQFAVSVLGDTITCFKK